MLMAAGEAIREANGKLREVFVSKLMSASIGDVALMTWSVASMNEVDPTFFRHVANFVIRTNERIRGQDVGNVAWAFGRVAPGLREPKYMARLFGKLMGAAVEGVEKLSFQHVANITWACSRVGGVEDG